MSEATYWEYCEKCQDDTPHRFLYRLGLTWWFQCKRCGQRKTMGAWRAPKLPWDLSHVGQR